MFSFVLGISLQVPSFLQSHHLVHHLVSLFPCCKPFLSAVSIPFGVIRRCLLGMQWWNLIYSPGCLKLRATLLSSEDRCEPSCPALLPSLHVRLTLCRLWEACLMLTFVNVSAHVSKEVFMTLQSSSLAQSTCTPPPPLPLLPVGAPA